MADVLRRIARWRVPAGTVTAIVLLWLAHPTPRTILAGAIIGAFGEAIRIWAAGHLEKGREVTRSGPYRFTRHPLYFGSTLLGAGFAAAANSVVVALIVGIYLAVTLTAAVRTEEAVLTEKFGGEYPAYRDGTAPAVARPFSLERAIRNKEYRAATGFVAIIVVMAAKALLWQ